MQGLAIVVALLCYRSAYAATIPTTSATTPPTSLEDTTIIVPSSTIKIAESHEESTKENNTISKPEMYYFHVESDVKLRYARTLISTRIVNPAAEAQEVSFTAVLPETAFISKFVMEVDGKSYEAYVKEKEEAKREYTEAVDRGQTAAHVALTARDSNRFTVSVNVEPLKKVTFNLTYEELLNRKLGLYKHVINLDPGQIVKDFNVTVRIEESSNITTVKVPALRTSNEIKEEPEDSANTLATIEQPTPQSALIKFAPTPEQQRELATEGLKGQLIVEYDVDRTSHPGEVLVNDGYFVHFFAPAELSPLNKQVTFVLDVSGSMSGRKIEQLRQAMTIILDDLKKDDLFSIVLFSETALAWDPTLNETQLQAIIREVGNYYPYEERHIPPKPTASVIAKATQENINKAKEFVGKLEALSSTAIYDGLMMALEISKLGHEEEATSSADSNRVHQQEHEPIIIFLTDGQANVRVSDPKIIVKDVTNNNTEKSSIFSLALGDDADFNFLKKLSLQNSGFARKIYEASDTALQLRDFYREVASPLLANVTFEYGPDEVVEESVTKHVFRRLFAGSELVVAGKLRKDNLTAEVQGSSASGYTEFPFTPFPIDPIFPFPQPSVIEHVPSAMERMWAYLTIQQLLEEDEAKDYNREDKNQTSPEKQRALELALQYSFVTPLTSLVVVKPNETKPVNAEDASKSSVIPSYFALPALPVPMGPPMGFPGSNSLAVGFPSAGFPAGSFGGGSFGGNVYAEIEEWSTPLGYTEVVNTLETTTDLQMTEESYTDVVNTVKSTTTDLQVTEGKPGTKLVSIDDLIWLPSIAYNGSAVILPTRPNRTDEVLLLAPANETNVPYSPCNAPENETGHCRHLRFCSLNIFIASKEEYLQYFCRISSYVGVCCPDYLS